MGYSIGHPVRHWGLILPKHVLVIYHDKSSPLEKLIPHDVELIFPMVSFWTTCRVKMSFHTTSGPIPYTK